MSDFHEMQGITASDIEIEELEKQLEQFKQLLKDAVEVIECYAEKITYFFEPTTEFSPPTDLARSFLEKPEIKEMVKE